jgi:4'-phosphopantetheinyl transferase
MDRLPSGGRFFYGGTNMIKLYLRRTELHASQAAHELLEEVLGISEKKLQYGPQGKPFLPEGPQFNLSHSRDFVGAAVSDGPVGLDLELVRPYFEKLPARIFSPGELRWFRDRGETRLDFFTLWTLKESYYKFLGTGLPGFPNGTEFYFDGAWHLQSSDLFFTVLTEKNLCIALCGDTEEKIRMEWR